jgi:hypothetical protein
VFYKISKEDKMTSLRVSLCYISFILFLNLIIFNSCAEEKPTSPEENNNKILIYHAKLSMIFCAANR